MKSTSDPAEHTTTTTETITADLQQLGRQGVLPSAEQTAVSDQRLAHSPTDRNRPTHPRFSRQCGAVYRPAYLLSVGADKTTRRNRWRIEQKGDHPSDNVQNERASALSDRLRWTVYSAAI